MKKILILAITFISAFGLNTSQVFAHAVVKPATAPVASFTDFSLGVPAEKDATTVAVKLMLPTGLGSISPIVKPGWQVAVKNGPIPSGVKVQPDDDGNIPDSIPVEIDWTGGLIPSGQKDFFQFSAQVPAAETELDWKIIQTYSDGSTVSWTLGPNDSPPKDDKGNIDTSNYGPYSKTMVINDLKPSATPATVTSTPVLDNRATNIAFVALALSAVALAMGYKQSFMTSKQSFMAGKQNQSAIKRKKD